MKTVLLKFAGPLQSWGSSSHFEIRHTDPFPSKSAVTGLIAAALGYRRNEDEKIRGLNRLHFAVRIDQPGQIEYDYQTAHKYKDSRKEPDPVLDRTYVTRRYYLEDAVFVVAVGHEDAYLIERITEALKHPYFQLYMGRRSCPVPEDFILGVVDSPVVASLEKLPLQIADWYKKKYPGKVFIYADAKELPDSQTSLRRDNIVSLSPEGREYEWREESRKMLELPVDHEDHDAFDALEA